MSELLGKGVYTVNEASRLTAVSPRRIVSWFSGWDRGAGPLLRGDYDGLVSGRRLLSFLDLIEVYVVGRLRDRNVTLQSIRKAYAELHRYLKTDHPFSHEE